jgi:flagellar motor switch protein FliG
MPEKSPKTTFSHAQKVAILLMALDTQSSGLIASVFHKLDIQNVRNILKEITHLGTIDAALVDGIMDEFYQFAIEKNVVVGGKNISRRLMSDSFGIDSDDDYLSGESDTIDSFSEISDDDLLRFFKDENDQCIAFCLSKMPEDKVASILSEMSLEHSFELSQRILKMDIIDTSLMDRFLIYLKDGISKHSDTKVIESEQQVVKLSRALERMSSTTSQKIIDLLGESNKEVADTISSMMFSFNDILNQDPMEVQKLLYEIDPLKTLALSIIKMPQEFKTFIYENVSERVGLMIDEEIEAIGDDVSDEVIEKSKMEIVQLVRRLEKKGKITVSVRKE